MDKLHQRTTISRDRQLLEFELLKILFPEEASINNMTIEGGDTLEKVCEVTEAPATNRHGQNGINRCWNCWYTNVPNSFTNVCIFIPNQETPTS